MRLLSRAESVMMGLRDVETVDQCVQCEGQLGFRDVTLQYIALSLLREYDCSEILNGQNPRDAQ